LLANIKKVCIFDPSNKLKTITMEETIYIPENTLIEESNVYLTINQISEILKKYKLQPTKIVFIAEMLEN
jgi:hypothetical protein